MRFEILQILAHELHFFFKEQKPNYVIFVSLIKASENTTTKNRGTSQKDKENQQKCGESGIFFIRGSEDLRDIHISL